MFAGQRLLSSGPVRDKLDYLGKFCLSETVCSQLVGYCVMQSIHVVVAYRLVPLEEVTVPEHNLAIKCWILRRLRAKCAAGGNGKLCNCIGTCV